MATALLIAATTGAHATAAYDQAFVDAFAEACVPGRLGFDSTKQAALAAGWVAVERSDHPELAAIMEKSDVALAGETEMEVTSETTLFARDFAGSRHHLAVSYASFVFDDDADPWQSVGCHLYNLDATAALDPAPVTALIGKPISRIEEQDGVVAVVWGPPCPMPRTGDTYLSFIAEGSPMAAQTGFTGIALNFSTSVPDPGEEVPETYC
jgi:hypothetical protein